MREGRWHCPGLKRGCKSLLVAFGAFFCEMGAGQVATAGAGSTNVSPFRVLAQCTRQWLCAGL